MKVKQWVRWILFFPAAFLADLATQSLISGMVGIVEVTRNHVFTFRPYLDAAAWQFLAPLAFVAVGTYVAPRGRTAVAALLSSVKIVVAIVNALEFQRYVGRGGAWSDAAPITGAPLWWHEVVYLAVIPFLVGLVIFARRHERAKELGEHGRAAMRVIEKTVHDFNAERLAGKTGLEAEIELELAHRRTEETEEFFRKHGWKRTSVQEETAGSASCTPAELTQPEARRTYADGVEFQHDGRAVLHVPQEADFELLIRPTARIFRHDLLPEEMNPAASWAARVTGIALMNGVWQEEHEQAFVRGFERFIWEGNSPSEDTRGHFANMSHWLRNKYPNLVGSPLNIDLDEEMRQVYRKMLGGQVASSASSSGSL